MQDSINRIFLKLISKPELQERLHNTVRDDEISSLLQSNDVYAVGLLAAEERRKARMEVSKTVELLITAGSRRIPHSIPSDLLYSKVRLNKSVFTVRLREELLKKGWSLCRRRKGGKPSFIAVRRTGIHKS